MACRCLETQLEGAIHVWIDELVEMHYIANGEVFVRPLLTGFLNTYRPWFYLP